MTSDGRGDRERIPFVVRVGVTGHRRLTDEEALRGRIKQALARIRELFPPTSHTGVSFAVVTALAEGADRLVARTVMEEGGALEVCLPRAQDEYLADFETAGSKEEFSALLDRAGSVFEIPPVQPAEKGYELAGRYVADRCDVLVALWDRAEGRGQGGTKEIVCYAVSRRKPVLAIGTEGEPDIAEYLGLGSVPDAFAVCAEPPLLRRGSSPPIEETRAAFEELDRFNARPIPAPEIDDNVREERGRLGSVESRAVEGLPVEQLTRWVIPSFVRADALAMRYEALYYRIVNLQFVLAGGAVALATVQELFARGHPELVWVEAALIVGALVTWAVGRWSRIHDHWISCRYLAERLRAAFFLAAAGLHNRREGGLVGASSEPEQDWVRRAFSHVWNRRPPVTLDESQTEHLRSLLLARWIDGQIDYHRRKSAWHRTRLRRFHWASGLLFGGAVVAAVLRAVSVWEPQTDAGRTVVLFAAVLPAFGAAATGILAHRQHERHMRAYTGTAESLIVIRELIAAAPDLVTIGKEVAEAENIMASENRDWLGVMAFHDFDLHL